MQATALLAVAIVAAFVIAIVIGLAWFIAVPVLVLLLLVPIAYMITLVTQRNRGRAPARASQGAPSTREASYQPISDPAKPGTTPR